MCLAGHQGGHQYKRSGIISMKLRIPMDVVGKMNHIHVVFHGLVMVRSQCLGRKIWTEGDTRVRISSMTFFEVMNLWLLLQGSVTMMFFLQPQVRGFWALLDPCHPKLSPLGAHHSLPNSGFGFTTRILSVFFLENLRDKIAKRHELWLKIASSFYQL